jgi:hypothetical protein
MATTMLIHNQPLDELLPLMTGSVLLHYNLMMVMFTTTYFMNDALDELFFIRRSR